MNPRLLSSVPKIQAKLDLYGATWDSATYQGNQTPFVFTCCCGKPRTATWNNLQKARAHALCTECLHQSWSQTSIADSRRQTALDRLRIKAEGAGATILSYSSDSEPLTFRCACGVEATRPAASLKKPQTRFQCQPCMILRATGENSPTWKPELTEEDRLAGRNYHWYREWEEAVLKAHDYRCVISGERNGHLAVHHLYNWAHHPDLRRDPHNGVVLTRPLHLEFHRIYGRGHNTLEQFQEFHLSRTGHSYVSPFADCLNPG